MPRRKPGPVSAGPGMPAAAAAPISHAAAHAETASMTGMRLRLAMVEAPAVSHQRDRVAQARMERAVDASRLAAQRGRRVAAAQRLTGQCVQMVEVFAKQRAAPRGDCGAEADGAGDLR